jgi:geranylgeranyl reductase family protein
MQPCDVLIVGGGPAGSTCAWRLRRAGLAVVVLDKSAFPRDKVCAGWITPAVIEELELDVDDYRRSRVFQPITSFRTSLLGGPEIATHYGQPVSYGIRRCEFDDYLLRRCGAVLDLGEPLATLERNGGGWTVNQRYQTPMVIGAGGHFCPVARLLGNERRTADIVVAAQEIEFEMDAAQQAECRVAPETPEVYFCRDLEGYGWCVRKGNFLNVGLGRRDRRRIGSHVAEFCDYLAKEGRIPRELPGKFRGHAYLDYEQSPRKLLDDGILVVGDAAGLAYAQSGEGIRPAIESGLMAADVILAAGGNYNRDRLEPYREVIHERFGRRDGRSLESSHLAGLKRFVARRLLANRWFVRHVVLDRFFLHRHQAAWRPRFGR